MKRIFNVLLVAILLSYYVLVPITVIAEMVPDIRLEESTIASNEDELKGIGSIESGVFDLYNSTVSEENKERVLIPQLFFYKNQIQQNDTSLEFSKDEKIVIKIAQENLTETTVNLPQGFRLVEKLSENLDGATSYNQLSRKVIITWDNKKEIELELATDTEIFEETLVFKGLNQEEEEIINEELVIKSKEVEITPTMIEQEITKEKEWEETSNLKEEGSMQLATFSTNLNIDVSYTAQNPKIDSGMDGIFILEFKVTGSIIKYEQVELRVKLPSNSQFTQNLNELTIAGVIPTYDKETDELMYHFDTLKTGQTYKTVIRIQTDNGITLNGTELKSKASLILPDLPAAEKVAQIVVQASTPFSMTKVYAGTYSNINQQNPKTTPPLQGDYSLWEISANVGKNELGSLYLKEGSKVVIVDKLPQHLNFISASDRGVYNSVNRTVTWEFNAPSIEEQKELRGSLFAKALTIQTQFAQANDAYSSLTNTVSGEITDLAGVKSVQNKSATISILQGSGGTTPTSGTLYYSQHRGPLNGKGAFAPADGEINPVPTVYDSDLLKFATNFYYAANNNQVWRYSQNKWTAITVEEYNAASVANQGFKKLEVNYTIDNKLHLEEFSTAVPRQNAFVGAVHPLIRLPEATYSLKLRGAANFSTPVKIDFSKAVNQKLTFTRDQLGLADNQDVSEIKITYLNGEPRTTSHDIIQALFSIKKGSRGEVNNSVYYDLTTIGNVLHRVSPINRTSSLGDRQAMIAEPPAGTLPIALTTVGLMNQENGVLEAGENRLKVTLSNDKSSLKRLTGPFTSYVLLPEGIRLSDNVRPDYKDYQGLSQSFGEYEKVTDSYQGTGRQLIKISWAAGDLLTNQSISAFLNVEVDEDPPLPLEMSVYSYSQDLKLQIPNNANPGIVDSYLDSNSDKMGSGYSQEHNRVRSGNRYTMVKNVAIQTEKQVKGQLDEDFSYFGHTLPGGRIDYKLKLTNTSDTKITAMTLIDVLPSVGDLGITDNVMRESKFTPLLAGPIVLPTTWQNKVDIFYSTATNPKRDDLTANVNYPEGTAHLTNPTGAEEPEWLSGELVTDWETIHSFKLVLKKGTTWLSSETLLLDFSMRAPWESELANLSLLDATIPKESRAAWNSFAIAVNDLQVVEPARVGVSLEVEKPTIHKNIEEKEHLDLENRHQVFTWNITTTFGNSASLWESAIISDQINELLEIQKIELLDSNGGLVSGTLTTVNNLVKIVLPKKEESFSYLIGETYTLHITTKIRADVTAADLEPYIKSGGIPNQAELEFGHSLEKVVSEIPKVTPPELTPLPDTGGIGREFYLIFGCLLLVSTLYYFKPLMRKEEA